MRRLLALLGPLLLATGCVTLPETGPVTSVPSDAAATPPGLFDYNPQPPEPGDGPATIVNGFLDALRETPLTYGPARSFLTQAGGADWVPSRRTIVYDDGTLSTQVVGAVATVRLDSTVELDSRGSWLGDPSSGRGISFDLHVVQEDGEWRIADPPDALIVSRTHFDTRFTRYDLHFADPTARVLVPEPVYLPAGEETPTLLVSGLLAGPDPDLQTVERSFFPPGTRLELDVPVQGGLADVSLSEEILDVEDAQLELALAQLAWTLRQVPGVERMRVTVDGAPVDRNTGASVRSVLGWTLYDPRVSEADSALYALSGRGVVSIGEDGEEAGSRPLPGPRARSLAVSLGVLEESRLATVSADGRRVLSGPRDSIEPLRPVYDGSDVLRPAYDRCDQLWLVDRGPRGARVVVVSPAGRGRVIDVPGVSGETVSSFEISRDGTRFAAVVGGSVVIARISRSEAGRPTSVGETQTVPLGDLAGRAIDLAWATASTLGILVRLGPGISQVRLAGVDGSSLANEASLESLFERALDLVTSPGPESPIYLQATSGVFEASPTGRWVETALAGGLRALTFAG